LINKSTVYNIV